MAQISHVITDALEKQHIRANAIGLCKFKKGLDKGPGTEQGLANRNLWARSDRTPLFFFFKL